MKHSTSISLFNNENDAWALSSALIIDIPTASPWLSGPRNMWFIGIDKKLKVIWLTRFFTNKSLQYCDPDNQGLDWDFFFDYRELFLDLVILIEDLLYIENYFKKSQIHALRLVGNFLLKFSSSYHIILFKKMFNNFLNFAFSEM